MNYPSTYLPSGNADLRLLLPSEVITLQREIEAGVLAHGMRQGGPRLVEATDAELVWLERAGHRARQRFIQANLPLVAMVARQFAGRGGVSSADLFQEGCVGLIIAVERFDHARGHRFSTYALFWIRAYVRAATARHSGDLNLPTSRAEELRAAQAEEADLTQRLGRQPSVAELAAVLGRGERWTAGLMGHERPRSIDEVDVEAMDDAAALAEFDRVLGSTSTVSDLLCRLDPVARRVIEVRLGFASGRPESLAKTARLLRISVGRVRRIEQSAIEKLQAWCPHQASALL